MWAVEQAEAWQLGRRVGDRSRRSSFLLRTLSAKRTRFEREDRAKAICRSCVVRADCLDYAIRIREPHGIWGGLNEDERKQLAERRAG